MRRDKEQQRQKARTKKEPKPSSKVVRYKPRPDPRPTKKRNHGYAANEDFDSALEDSSPISDSDSTQDENDEVCRLSKEEIGKATPSSWSADTGATSHMSDQPSLFSTMIPIKARRVKVGGGELAARHMGNAKLQCIDGSSMVLKDVLYVPKIGVNLVSARRLCQAGLTGSFDDSHMYFKQDNKKVVTATMTNDLYIITHVSKKCQDTAFVGVENTNEVDTEEDTADDNEEAPILTEDKTKYNMPLSDKEKRRYLKYHQRFAHLNPKKISNLHKVTTLTRPIRVPNKDDMDVCEICAISKIRNKISRELSPWTKQILGRIQFDIAGPFPTTIRKNEYFLLIIDIYSRRDWVLPLKLKSDAYDGLKTWRIGVELQSQAKILSARSDNTPELLKVTDEWRVADGVEAQSTTIASSHQNGPAERSIQTVEADTRAMLTEAQMPIEFWDEAAEADSYLRNRTDTGPKVDGQRISPIQAFTKEIPSINHIRKWGSKCYYHVSHKAIPPNRRHDKLVNPGRVGVFMGYSESTTKHFKIYSPEHGYTIKVSRIEVDEKSKGGTVDLRLRVKAGPQGTKNLAPDRNPKGRPKKEQSSPTLPLTTQHTTQPATVDLTGPAEEIKTVPQAEIPLFIPPPNVPAFTKRC